MKSEWILINGGNETVFTDLHHLGLSVRTFYKLLYHGITTSQKLKKISNNKLTAIVGSRSAAEIRQKLLTLN
jgi:DNA-directed RNA polymerase alpha subunit